MGDRATPSVITDAAAQAGEPPELLQALARALGRQAAREMWRAGSGAEGAPANPATPPVQPVFRHAPADPQRRRHADR